MLSLLSIAGFALYGLPFLYDFFVEDAGLLLLVALAAAGAVAVWLLPDREAPLQ